MHRSSAVQCSGCRARAQLRSPGSEMRVAPVTDSRTNQMQKLCGVKGHARGAGTHSPYSCTPSTNSLSSAAVQALLSPPLHNRTSAMPRFRTPFCSSCVVAHARPWLAKR